MSKLKHFKMCPFCMFSIKKLCTFCEVRSMRSAPDAMYVCNFGEVYIMLITFRA